MKRNGYNKDFKARVALEAIKGQKTASEFALEYGVHICQINRWKNRLLEAAPDVECLKKDRASRRSMEAKRRCSEPDHARLASSASAS